MLQATVHITNTFASYSRPAIGVLALYIVTVILLRGIPITYTFPTGVNVQGIDALLSWTPVWKVYRSLDMAVLSRDCCNAAYYIHKYS